MAIHLAEDHATCFASRQLTELSTQSSNKQWPSVGCIMGLFVYEIGQGMPICGLGHKCLDCGRIFLDI